jgi:ketosteroid isomerase-like protein
MPEHPNVQIVRDAIAAMDRGDFAAASSFLADDIVWHYIGGSAPLVGKQAMVDGLGGGGEWTIKAEVHDVLANDTHAVALVRAHAERGGRTLDYDTVEIMHMKDGKFTERWAFSDDTARIVEFFG